jgi:threonine dehydrogenase-like Zn-dependent dehydrogenase
VVGHHAHKLALAGDAEGVLESELGRELEGVPAVVEATGSARGLQRALALLRPRGHLILKTTVAGTSDVDLSPIVINELRVFGSRCGDMPAAVAALAAGFDPTPLIGARYPLAEAERAFAHASQRGTLKVVVER